MPTVALHPPLKGRTTESDNPLPQLLQTPSGLAILEIQGTVNTSTSETSASHTSSPIGKLVFPEKTTGDDTSWQKQVHLYIGKHQRLTGEIKKLPKPLAVIRRRQSVNIDTDELEIAEVVYYKLLFAHRPEPVGSANE